MVESYVVDLYIRKLASAKFGHQNIGTEPEMFEFRNKSTTLSVAPTYKLYHATRDRRTTQLSHYLPLLAEVCEYLHTPSNSSTLALIYCRCMALPNNLALGEKKPFELII